MKRSWLAMTGLAAAFFLINPAVGQVQEELFSDTFSTLSRDNAKWRDSTFLDSTAKFRIRNGKVVLSRNTKLMDIFQQVQWDSKFVRLYDANDYLQIGATVRVPNKVRSGDEAFSIGIGLVSGGAQFVELAVEDNADSRTFSLFFEDTDTAFSDTLFFDAPQNITVFDLVITYSAVTDNLAFYWSVPGVERLFRIGEILNFSAAIGGVGPRRIRPYIIGLLFDNAQVPVSWNVWLDDFYAYRENAP